MTRLKKMGLSDLYTIKDAAYGFMPPAYSRRRILEKKLRAKISDEPPRLGRVDDDEVLFKTDSEAPDNAEHTLGQLRDLAKDRIEQEQAEMDRKAKKQEPEEVRLEDLDGVSISDVVDLLVKRMEGSVEITSLDEGMTKINAEHLDNPPIPLTEEPEPAFKLIPLEEVDKNLSGPGLIWDNEIRRYELEDNSDAMGLPEKEVRWIIPTEEATGIEIRGKCYHITEEHAAGSMACLRNGNTLHVWSSLKHEPELLESLGVREYQQAEWPEGDVSKRLTKPEFDSYSRVLPENRAVLLHPSPDEDTRNEHDKIIRSIYDGTVPEITIGDRSYYILDIEKMSDWMDNVFNLPNTRMAARTGDLISVWNMNGYSLFKCESTVHHRTSYGPRGDPLPEKGGVKVYDMEKADVSEVYKTNIAEQKGTRDMYLYELPERISDMDAEELVRLISISTKYIEKEGHSPLISVRGRWHIALEHPNPNAVQTSYEEGMVIVHTEAPEWSRALQNMKVTMQHRKDDDSFVTMPKDPKARMPLLELFPADACRYLLLAKEGELYDVPLVTVENGHGSSQYWVFKTPVEGSFMVERNGESITKVEPRKPAEMHSQN